jgi:predicted MPP superfamily phosphohydrolase
MKKTFLKLIISTITVCLALLLFISKTSGKISDEPVIKPELKFNAKGKFKIVQFADSQDGPDIHPKTLKLMENILDYEKPDLVVLTGDNIDGRSKSEYEVRMAIDNLARPMEERNIPWAVVFGNHDEDHKAMSKEQMMKLYMSYPHNISEIGLNNANRVGNYNLLIRASNTNIPALNIYMLDSGSYAPKDIGVYDWIRPAQIEWYKNTSLELSNKYNRTIPSLMFFHIPLPEFKTAYKEKHIAGTRNEEECISSINSGLFDTIKEVGDVKGIFVGHDHSNDYIAELNGIRLGYSRCIGFGTYIKSGFSRGGRVFLIDEKDPGNFKTWMRLESDFKW